MTEQEEFEFRYRYEQEQATAQKDSGFKVPQTLKDAFGGIDAAVSMGAQLPAMAVGGLYGLGTALSGQGIDKATENMNKVIESNFGLGKPQPFTEEGKQVEEMLQHGMETAVGETVGGVSKLTGSDTAGNLAGLGTELALNLLPVPGYKGVQKASRAIEKKLERPSKKKPSIDDIIAEEKAAQSSQGTKPDAKFDPKEVWEKRETKPTNVQADVARLHDQSILENLQKIEGDLEAKRVDDYIKSKKAQMAIEERNRQMEADVARQRHFDEEARVRKMEGTGYQEWLAAREAERSRRSEDAQIEQNITQALGDEQGPIYVDPQGQAFRGDPNDPNARLALERQTEAFEGFAEMKPDVYEGEPLPGLQKSNLGDELREMESATKEVLETLRNPFKGPGRRQAGAIDPQVFKEGYKRLAKALSNLTDQPWLAKAFPKEEYMTNSDGTPMVLLHGTVKNIDNNMVAGRSQGFHAGFVTSPHFFVTSMGQKNGKAVFSSKRVRENAQLYPVAIKKGNYPFLPFDEGSWNPAEMFSGSTEGKFKRWLEFEYEKNGHTANTLNGDINYILNSVGVAEKNKRFSAILKKRLNVDGFFYKNEAESPRGHRKAALATRVEKAKNLGPDRVMKEIEGYHKVGLQDPTSFVTWNDKNFQSIYDDAPQNKKESTKAAWQQDIDDWLTSHPADVNKFLKKIDQWYIDGKLTPEEFTYAVDAAVEAVAHQKRGSGVGKQQGGAIDLDMLTFGLASKLNKKLHSQTGMNAEVIPPNERKPVPVLTPAEIEQRQKQRQLAERLPVKDKVLEEFAPIRTPEEALALAKQMGSEGDITKDFGQRSLGSGSNFVAAMSNNPLVKFLRTMSREVRAQADNFSMTYITHKQKGLTPLWSSMKGPERIKVMEALMAGDRHQVLVSDSMMDKLGFSDKQRQFVKTFYEADRKLYQDWKTALESVGLRVPDERTGHFPGIFSGAYKTLVMQDNKVIGVIPTDTVWQRNKAKEHFKKQFGDTVTFIDQDRRGMAGVSNRHYSDIFSGMNDVIKMLAEKDPRFAEVKVIVDEAITKANNALYGFNVHELHKKGVIGNEGNKPWRDAEQNANDAFKALVSYFEEGAMHHALQVPAKHLKDVAKDPWVIENMPNAAKYVEDYTNKMLGRELSELGAALNTIIDSPFKLVGVGPAIPLKIAGTTKNTMSQLFMGWGNYMFTAAQLLQPVQTHLPFMQLAAGRLGLSQADVVASSARGGVGFMRAILEEMTGKDYNLPSHLREGYTYARDRGMIRFSELEEAHQGTQSKLGRMKDEAAEANMKFGEWATRTSSFMSAVDLLVTGGVDVKMALPIAENMTQFSMIDYHQFERPSVYQKLGVAGGFASGLTTFKHGLLSQQTYLAKQMIKPSAGGNKQFTPFITQMAVATLVLAGLTGLPFYDEIDGLVRLITDKAFGKQQGIRDIFLKNHPEWLKSGLLSHITGQNLQGKFSAADMKPDSLARWASPHLEGAWKIFDAAIEAAKNRDEQGMRNFLMAITPSGWKRATEAVVARDPEGYVIDKDNNRSVYRTPDEWRDSVLWQSRPQDEAVEKEEFWDGRQRLKADQDRLKDISSEFKRRISNNNLPPQVRKRLMDEYMKRGGDVKTLIQLFESVPQEKKKTEEQRLEGVPNSLPGIHRFRNFNQ